VSDPSGTGPTDASDDEGIDLGIDGVQHAVEIGVGGFGRVYRAKQPAFGRTVAVKVLSVGKLDDKSQSRFERECQAMGALSGHPNIVTVFDAGTTTEGRPYLLMEYMSGGSYDDKLKQSGTLTWQEAAEVGAKVSAALQVAHDAGIVHRDIKPANVLISRFAEPQLGDFGIARITGGSETKSGVITASMAHAAPEVLDGTRPSGAADVYAVGSMVYEMLAGVPAFFSETDETNLAMIRRIYDDPVPDLREKGVPEPIARVVEQAMAKKPDQRQASAAALAEQFRAALRDAGDTSGAAAAEQAAAAGAAAVADVDPYATTDVAAPPPVLSTPIPTPPPGYVSAPVPTPPPGMPPGAVPFDTGPVPPPGSTGPVPVGAKKGGGGKVVVIVIAAVLALLLAGGVAALAITLGGDDEPVASTLVSPSSVEPTSPTSDTFDPGTTDPTDEPDPDEPGAAEPVPTDIDSLEEQGLASNCFDGDLEACDTLWLTSDVGSNAEEYGGTCGGRLPDSIAGNCVEDLG
jgi:hypothetical protein